MRSVYKLKKFDKWMKKSGLTDEDLSAAVSEMETGLVEAKLGNNLFKKRISIKGTGKRGGCRTLVATNLEDKWFFIEGFKKNERSNISDYQLGILRKLSEKLLDLGLISLRTLIIDEKILVVSEVSDENEKK